MRSVVLITTLLLVLPGCEKKVDPRRLQSGEDLYAYYCLDCHIRHGPGARMERFAGKTPLAPHKTVLMIKYGFNQGSHSMPLFDQLSDEQADKVATYVAALQAAQAGH